MTTAILILLLGAVIAAIVAADRARTDATRLRLLVEMSGFLQMAQTMGELSETVPVFGRHVFRGISGTLRLRRSAGAAMDTVAAWGDTNEPVPAAEMCIPLLAQGEAIGALTLRAGKDHGLPEGTEFFAHAFADQIALALANLHQQETLRTHAAHDALTGLYNRRYVEETLERELQQGVRKQTQVGVILIDVDHFKRFNDTWGHGGGDVLLQELARLMRSVAGENDLVCRYGGEEFVIIVPDATTDLLRARAERLRDFARTLEVTRDGVRLDRITVSAGIGISPTHATTVSGLIAAADRALYAAKSAGRDRVCSPPPQVVGRDAA